MTAARGKLRLVPSAATEKSAGEILTKGHETVLSDPNSISAALGLYFQWEKKRSCRVSVQTAKEKKSFDCEMDYDRDEASPSEIKLTLRNFKGSAEEVYPGTPLTIRFEVFKTRYDFTAPVSAAAQDSAAEGWHFITDIPMEIKIARSPQLHRLALNDEMRVKLPQASWVSSGSGSGSSSGSGAGSAGSSSALPLKILEIGMLSWKAEIKTAAAMEKQGLIQWGDLVVPAAVEHVENDGVVLQLRFESHAIFGKYFDLYRQVAYPRLRSRYEVPFEKGIDLYTRTTYFSLFNSEKSREEKQKICDTWEAIKTGFHHTNADYYVTDEKGEPTGCSGLALTNFAGEKPIWTFHQLCALKNPNLLEQSGTLYTWRAEYLAARPEDLAVWGTFRSKSRWLERIYVKHAQNSKKGTKLLAVALRRCTFSKGKSNETQGLKKYPIGKSFRTCTVSEDIWAGIGPKFLNANDNLETIVTVFKEPSIEDIQTIGGQFANLLGTESASLVLVTPIEKDLSEIGGRLQAQDRIFIIPKGDLSNFMSSVEHSTAVAERKLHNGTIE